MSGQNERPKPTMVCLTASAGSRGGGRSRVITDPAMINVLTDLRDEIKKLELRPQITVEAAKQNSIVVPAPIVNVETSAPIVVPAPIVNFTPNLAVEPPKILLPLILSAVINAVAAIVIHFAPEFFRH
jgi:hypothetical protein